MHKTCTGSNQRKSQHGYKWIQHLTLSVEAIAFGTCWQGSYWTAPLPAVEYHRSISHALGRPHAQERLTNTEWRPWIFLSTFFVAVVLLGSLLLMQYHGQVAMVL